MVSLPNDTLSNRAVGLLAFGMTRSWGLDQVNKDSGGTVRRAVERLADLAAQRLLVAVVDGEASRVQVVVEMGGKVSVQAIEPAGDNTADPRGTLAGEHGAGAGGCWSPRDCALIAGALMKVSISDHAVWPLLAAHVARIARAQTAQGPAGALSLQDGAYLAEALAWQLRVAKTPAMLAAVETLVPVLGQTLIEAARAGIKADTAYLLAVMLSARASLVAATAARSPNSTLSVSVNDTTAGARGDLSTAAPAPAAAGLRQDQDEQVWAAAGDAVKELLLPGGAGVKQLSTHGIAALLSAFSRAGTIDALLLQHLAQAALARADRGEASIAHMAAVLSALANSNLVWVQV